jgi:flagellin-like protein
MSANRRERKQRYLRGLRGEKSAVSPVVATLILILIAVAAAAALYLWLVAWQGNITGGIGNQNAQYTVTIGGSTSVYPFSSLGATWFEQNNSDIVISDNQGGTGAGMLAVCAGNINVGAASTPETPAGLIASDGCPSTPGITVTTIAYDAVDVVIAGSNDHGLLSMNFDTLLAIYDHASTTAPSLVATTINGAAFVPTFTALTPIQWGQIPAAVSGYVVPTTPTTTTEAVLTTIGAGVACAGPGAIANDICAAGAPLASPCGWSVCAGPFVAIGTATSASPIVAQERSDASGTTQTFEAKLFGATSSSAVSTTFSGLGYSGCGSNNLLTDCGIALPTADQQSGVLSAVAANVNALGYASDGLARTTTGIGTAGIIPFDAVGQQGVVTGTGVVAGAVNPTTGASGTIAAGITASTTTPNYSGWRPFEFVTLQPPTGEVQRFIEFITDPANNAELATVTGEVGLYSI